MTATRDGLRVRLLSEPLLEGPSGACHLSPYQSALVVLVFAEGALARPTIASLLWDDGTPETKRRQRIRQLKNAIRRRAGGQVLEGVGDQIVPGAEVRSDLQAVEHSLAEGDLAVAADAVRHGFACSGITGISDEFDDWSEAFIRKLQSRIIVLASAKWEAARASSDWRSARDAAEALFVLRPGDADVAAKVIEARARVGRPHAAEVAYAAFAEREGDIPVIVQETIDRVRDLAQAPGASRPETRVPFVGRQEPLAELTSIFDPVREGSFSFALVAGEAGIGKTRLIREVERSARLEGLRCLSAEPVELERRIPLNPIIDALSDVELEPHLSKIGEPWRTVIGTMLPPGPHAESVQALPPIEERSLSRRLLDSFSLLFRSISREQPTIFFLDDLHWADATTIAALQFYQRRWNESYFGVVATVRPGLVGERHPAAPYLSDDSKLGVRRIDLEELTASEARRLVEVLGEEGMNPSDVTKLCALSGCHPLYLTELTRDFLSGRLKLPRSEADAFTIPISLRQILASRTETVGELACSVLHVLAVGSKPMRLSDLAEILDTTLDRAADSAEELGARQLIELDRDRLWIAHDLFRTAIYRDLSEAHRAVLHSKLADHIRGHSGDEAAGELATHLDRAGQTGQSAKYGWTAAGRAFERGAVAEAAHFFELVARNERDEPRKAEATAMLATSLHLNRDMSRANPALELASTRLRAAGMTDRARRMDIRRVEGLAEAGDTPVNELVERLGAIKRECHEAEDWEGVALALDAELSLRHSEGDFRAIRKTFAEMRRLAAFGPPEAQAVCHAGLAMGVLFGDPNEALTSAQKAMVLTETVRAHRLKALLRMMVVLQLRGRLQQSDSVPIIDEARELARTSGDVRIRFSVESNVAVALLDSGELDQADHMLEQSTKLLGSADMDLPRFNHANNRAELALARSSYQAARGYFLEAASYLGPTTPPYAAELVDAGIGLCDLECGKIREAQRREELLHSPTPPWYFDPSTVVTFQARLLELRRRYEQADRILEETADDLNGRMELAWLKVNKLRIIKGLKWSRGTHLVALTEQCIDVTSALSLSARHREFLVLRDRLGEG